MGVVRSIGMADDFASLVIVIFMGKEERHDHDHDHHNNQDDPCWMGSTPTGKNSMIRHQPTKLS